MSRLEKILYYTKYTAATYLDVLATIPIWTAEKIAQGGEKLLGNKNPDFLSFDYIRENSPIFRGREKLREDLGTRAGVLYLQSNIIGALPFIFAGMPAAEAAQAGIKEYLSQVPEVIQFTINSTITLATQMLVGYTAFMANEIRTNRPKYVGENGKISLRKIRKGLVNAFKGFLSFDIPYTLTKILGQTWFLYEGKEPWKASGLVDSIAFPLWYVVAIPIGICAGIVEPKPKIDIPEERN